MQTLRNLGRTDWQLAPTYKERLVEMYESYNRFVALMRQRVRVPSVIMIIPLIVLLCLVIGLSLSEPWVVLVVIMYGIYLWTESLSKIRETEKTNPEVRRIRTLRGLWELMCYKTIGSVVLVYLVCVLMLGTGIWYIVNIT